jgi:hypothetical protein
VAAAFTILLRILVGSWPGMDYKLLMKIAIFITPGFCFGVLVPEFASLMRAINFVIVGLLTFQAVFPKFKR